MTAIPAPPQMRMLAELGIAHGATRTPNGSYALTFPHVNSAMFANTLLTESGYTVRTVGPRGLLATAPVRLSFNQRHAIAAKRLKVTVLFLIFPVPYISVPVYAYLGIRWYRRTRPALPARHRTDAFHANARRLARQGGAAMHAAGLYEHVNVDGTVTTGRLI